MKFDENLAAIHAYLCADGYVIKNPPTQKNKYYYIGFRNTNETLLKDFQRRFNEYFSIVPRMAKDGRCVVQNKETYTKLINKFESFYSYEWSSPTLNKKLMKIWLRAFFDCEGWVFCKTHQNRHIGLDSVNEKGIDEIRRNLRKIGIETIKKENKKRHIYRIIIYGKENISKFQKEIGFLHPQKKQKLDHTIKDFMNYNWNFPKNERVCKQFIKGLTKKKAKISNGRYIKIISNLEKNLIELKKLLIKFYNINSLIYKMINGRGVIYYQLSINKKEEVQKLIKHKLIPNIFKSEDI